MSGNTPDQVVHISEEEPVSHTVTNKHTALPSKFSASKNLIIFVLSCVFIFLVLLNLLLFFFPRNIFTNAMDAVFSFSLPSISLNPAESPNKISTTTTQSPSPTPELSNTPTPSVSPTPRPPVFTDRTRGVLERATCEEISGWAYDPEKNEEAMNVWLYADGGLSGGIFSGNVKADRPRTDINSSLSIQGDHGFTFPVIPQLKDGQEHSLYVFVEGKDGVRRQLGNTPLFLTCP